MGDVERRLFDICDAMNWQQHNCDHQVIGRLSILSRAGTQLAHGEGDDDYEAREDLLRKLERGVLGPDLKPLLYHGPTPSELDMVEPEAPPDPDTVAKEDGSCLGKPAVFVNVNRCGDLCVPEVRQALEPLGYRVVTFHSMRAQQPPKSGTLPKVTVTLDPDKVGAEDFGTAKFVMPSGDHIHTVPVSQLERDLGLVCRYVKDSGTAHTYSTTAGEWYFETGANPCGSGPTLAGAIHSAAVAISVEMLAKHEELMRSTIESRNVLGDWTEGGTR